MAVSQGSILVLVLSIALTVDYARSQTYGEQEREWEGPTAPTAPTAPTGPTAPTTMAAGTTMNPAEVEPTEAAEEVITTPTTTTTTRKPKPRRRPKSRKRRPKNLKPRPRGRGRGRGRGKQGAAVKPAPKPTMIVTTSRPTTAPTIATTTTRAPAPVPVPTAAPVAPAAIPIVQTLQPATLAPIVVQTAQPQVGAPGGGGQYAASANNAAYGPQPQQVKVVPNAYQVTVRKTASTTKSPNQYLYEPHSCPKMDVATWENEVVIYDNKNCAIIVRMNPRLRRPTVTFQAPYW